MAKQVCDIQPSQGIDSADSNEQTRRWTEKQKEVRMDNPHLNYDFTRTHLDFEIVDGEIKDLNREEELNDSIRKALERMGIPHPDDTKSHRKKGEPEPKKMKRNIAARMILGGSPERMNQMAFGWQNVNLKKGVDNSHIVRTADIEEWAKDEYRWLQNTFGKNNIARFIVHLDETNPHIHATVIPTAIVKGKQRISWRSVFGGSREVSSQKFKAILDSHYDQVGQKWGLERGESVAVTGAQHKSTKEYYKELESLIKKCETKIKGLTTMIGNLEQQKEAIEIDITALEDEYAEKGNMSQEEYEKKLAEYQEKLDEIEAKIEDKELYLKQANANLQVLNKKSEECQINIKTMVDDALTAQDQRRQRLKELDDALKEKKAAIASADKTGELRNADKAISARDNIIFRHWPDAKPAVNAIIERTISPTATQFTPEQAMTVDRAIASAGIDREAAAEELLALAQKEFDMQRTFIGWIQAVTAEVHGISTGGSASYINDLTGWDGRKKGMGL